MRCCFECHVFRHLFFRERFPRAEIECAFTESRRFPRHRVLTSQFLHVNLKSFLSRFWCVSCFLFQVFLTLNSFSFRFIGLLVWSRQLFHCPIEFRVTRRVNTAHCFEVAADPDKCASSCNDDVTVTWWPQINSILSASKRVNVDAIV